MSVSFRHASCRHFLLTFGPKQPSAALRSVQDAISGVSPATPHSEEDMSRSEASTCVPADTYNLLNLAVMFSWNGRSKSSSRQRLMAKKMQQVFDITM